VNNSLGELGKPRLFGAAMTARLRSMGLASDMRWCAPMLRWALLWVCAWLASAAAWANTSTTPSTPPGAGPASTSSANAAQGCAPRITSVHAARGEGAYILQRSQNDAPSAGPPTALPPSAWVPVTLPDRWINPGRWPGHDGEVWYRVDWHNPCAAAASPGVALATDSINMAGELWVADTLLWRDRHLAEPLSRSWNVPRHWLLPAPLVQPGANTLWLRVVGPAAQAPGLGQLTLGAPADIAAAAAHSTWNKRTLFVVNVAISGALGVFFFFAWALRREQKAYGWYALASLLWVLFAANIVATETWPFSDSVVAGRMHMTMLVLYMAAFSVFTWRFGDMRLPRLQWALGLLTAAMVALTWLAPQRVLGDVLVVPLMWSAAVFVTASLLFVVRALRTRLPDHLTLALCMVLFVVVGLHDLLMAHGAIDPGDVWTPYSSLAITLCMALILGWRMARNIRRIERFNIELTEGIAHARADLQTTMAREHALVLRNTRLNERLGIAHELHDGLGGSLVRSIALVEQARAPLENRHFLSMLKLLRDDLRQMIDSGSSQGVTVPATPQQWLAPLRHRFTVLFDELDIHCHWHHPAGWAQPPNALQCLALTRLVEEALTNVIKHSRAANVALTLDTRADGGVTLRIEDDGVGFDVPAVLNAGVSVGMRSMQARIARVGGELQVQSAPGATVLTVHLMPTHAPESQPAPLL
jgi:signal transduction histidine kinase